MSNVLVVLLPLELGRARPAVDRKRAAAAGNGAVDVRAHGDIGQRLTDPARFSALLPEKLTVLVFKSRSVPPFSVSVPPLIVVPPLYELLSLGTRPPLPALVRL